jgi:putative ABC transport system permease protein
MIHLAKEDVRHTLGKFIVTAMGVGMLLGIVMIMMGVYRGMLVDAEVLLKDINADLWVVQQDTLGPFAEASRVHDDLQYTIDSLKGIDRSSVITFQNIQLPKYNSKIRVFAVGYDVYGDISPINIERLVEGRVLTTDHYEIVVTDKTGFSLHDKIQLGRNVYTVVGITHGSVSSGGICWSM